MKKSGLKNVRKNKGARKMGTQANEIKYLKFALLIIFLLAIKRVDAQALVPFDYTTYGLESDEHNIIQNAGHLENFFEELYQQRLTASKTISIIHIGDSHVQGDYMTTIVRKNFQKHFGNAGRGFIFPAKIAGTNQPEDFYSFSNSKWEVKRCVTPNLPLPIGIGGITIKTESTGEILSLKLNDKLREHAFTKFTIFCLSKDSYDLVIKDSLSVDLAIIQPSISDSLSSYTINLNKSRSEIKLEALKSSEDQTHATLFGVSLENERNGILYHAIGVNGARYEHYNQSLLFSKQTSALQPKLFIISLGTNEAINYPYLDKNFHGQIDKLVESLLKENPQAEILFVTPPAAFRKKIKNNPGISKIREQIIHYAVENGFAFYDLYKAMGGDNSANAWKKAGLIRSDGIHFTKRAYEYQGDLFFSALMKSYNLYVPLRHQ